MPAKRSPSSILASEPWRPAAIRNTAVWLVSAPHSVRRPPAVFQPVSSMLTTDARLELLLEPGVRRGERLPGALDDRVDRPGRQARPRTAPARARSCRGGRHGCGRRASRPRPAASARTPSRDTPAGSSARVWVGALGAAHTVQPMLGHPDRDRRQLGDLVSRTAPPRRRAPARRSVRARPAPARANARRPRRPARAQAAVGACPHARAGRPAPDPTPSRPDAAAPTEDPATAAATSSANSDSAAARARPPEPRAAGSPRPARPPATTTRQPSHDHHQGSPPPRHAPHQRVRHMPAGSLQG